MQQEIQEIIIRFLRGKLSLEEMKELQKWIDSSEENRKSFESVRKVWLAGSIHIENDNFDAEEGWNNLRKRQHKEISIDSRDTKKRFNIQQVLKIAATIVLFFSIGAVTSWFIFSEKGDNSLSEVYAPKGSKSLITLNDGSRVWLNAGSKLIYRDDFNKDSRLVKLEGEAYFDVTTNKLKPFVVQTSRMNVLAYGTKFNVKAYPEEETITATLEEGNIVVENNQVKGKAKAFKYELKPNESLTIVKNEKVREELAVNEKPDEEVVLLPKKIIVSENINTSLNTSWKDPQWVIKGKNLDEMAVLLERRYDIKVDIESEELKQYKFSGTIQNETLEQLMEILALTTPLNYELGKGVVTWQINPILEEKYKRELKN